MSSAVRRQFTANAEVGHLAEVHARERFDVALVPDHPAADVPAQNRLDGVWLRDYTTERGDIIAARTPAEVKAAVLRKDDGRSTRR